MQSLTHPSFRDLAASDSVLNNIGVFLDLHSRDSWSLTAKFWLSLLRERTWFEPEGAVTLIG